jgi:MFS family permease
MVPAVLVLMALAYSLSAYPMGVLSDRMNRVGILIAGLVLLVLADIVLAYSAGFASLAVGVALWGLHMGFTQGVLATLIADVAPSDLRGTAFGTFNLVTGVALLAASVLAGALWDVAGPKATFLAGAAFAAVTIAGLLATRGRIAAKG